MVIFSDVIVLSLSFLWVHSSDLSWFAKYILLKLCDNQSILKFINNEEA